MWDAIASMRPRRALSLATFASVFSSYAAAKDFPSALRAFDQMQSLHGIPRDAAALNSLLSAVCREGRADVARDFLRLRRQEVPPDSDSYAILLEGWENEGDAHRAREAFDEMVETVGWDPKNVPAYDSFLCTLLRGSGSGIKDAMKYLDVLKERRCCPGMKFFRVALEELVKAEDARGAVSLWQTIAGRNGCYPDAKMYYSMIKLQCYDDQTDAAMKYLDEMVIYGAFPDAKTYNVLLHYLLKGRKMSDSAAIFDEMVKNEFIPSEENCASAIRVFLDGKDWEMGIKVWKCMVENGYSVEESGNLLVGKLKDFDRLPEACKFAEDMIDRRVKLNSANLSKLRASLLKIGKGNIYDHILRKWKLR
nr:pentatricopeptide repeat protein AaPPR290 [Agave angustifolia]